MILSYTANLQKNTWTIYSKSFMAKEIQYLGHVLINTGIKPLPSKTLTIKLVNLPKTTKQVRAFLGLVGYYCKFIKNFAHIAKPLKALLGMMQSSPGHHVIS